MITRMMSYKGSVMSHAKLVSPSGVVSSVINKDQTPILTGLTDSSFCDMATNGDIILFAPARDATETVRVYDGVQMRNTYATVSPTQPLKCACLTWYRQLLFAANVRQMNENGVEEQFVNRIWWSNTDSPENFNPWAGVADYENFQDVGAAGEPIVRMVSFKNNLYIFKRNSIWRVWGVSSPDGSLVGPEMIVEVHPTIGLVAPNAICIDESRIWFISDGGVFTLVYESDSLQKEVPELHDIIERLDRAFWDIAVLSYSPTRKELYFAVGDHRHASDDLFVYTAEKAWFKWNMPSPVSCIAEMTHANGVTFVAVGDMNDGIGILDDNLRRDYDFWDVASDYGTDWEDLGSPGIKNLRSCELLMRVEGEFPVTLEVYHDLSQVPFETILVPLDGGTFDPSIGDVGPQAETDVAQADVSSTSDRDLFFTYPLELGGSCRKVRFRIVSTGPNARFKVARIAVGYSKGTGI